MISTRRMAKITVMYCGAVVQWEGKKGKGISSLSYLSAISNMKLFPAHTFAGRNNNSIFSRYTHHGSHAHWIEERLKVEI